MAFSGAWLQSNGPFDPVDMQRVHTADPAHDDTSSPDPNVGGYTAPQGVVSSGFGVPYEELMGGQGVLIEYSPQEHDLGIGEHAHPSDEYVGGSGLGSGDLTRSQRTMAQHAVSYGADVEYSPGPMQYYDERYRSIRSDGIGPLPITPVAVIRGPNSDPQNNPPINGQPEGFRLGSDLWTFVDRKFHIGERFHDRHIVMPNDADAPTNQIRGTGASPYLSPYDSAKRAITRAFNTPAQIVSPPDFSTDITEEVSVTATMMPDWQFS
jgi:hypothetical protein